MNELVTIKNYFLPPRTPEEDLIDLYVRIIKRLEKHPTKGITPEERVKIIELKGRIK